MTDPLYIISNDFFLFLFDKIISNNFFLFLFHKIISNNFFLFLFHKASISLVLCGYEVQVNLYNFDFERKSTF